MNVFRFKLPHCILSVLLGLSAQAATISVLPPSQIVNSGGQFAVSLRVSGLGTGSAPSVGTFDIDLGYDSLLLTFVSATYGTGLDIFSLGSIQLTTPGSGTVNLFELSLDNASDLNAMQPSDFVLATLTFSALADGMSPLALVINTLGDADGVALSADAVGGSVTVTSATSVPEPSSLLLVAHCFGALFVKRLFRPAGRRHYSNLG